MITQIFGQDQGGLGNFLQVKIELSRNMWALLLIFLLLGGFGILSYKYLPTDHIVYFFWIVGGIGVFFFVTLGIGAIRDQWRNNSNNDSGESNSKDQKETNKMAQ